MDTLPQPQREYNRLSAADCAELCTAQEVGPNLYNALCFCGKSVLTICESDGILLLRCRAGCTFNHLLGTFMTLRRDRRDRRNGGSR